MNGVYGAEDQHSNSKFLIRNAEIYGSGKIHDVRINKSIISEVGEQLPVKIGEEIIDAQGGTLLPGLHDHHLHLVSLAASLDSLQCGPPSITSADELIAVLAHHNDQAELTWLRGIGYHACVAGDIDRHWLDTCIPDRPVRIQQRGGRLWVLNSMALCKLDLGSAPSGLEKIDGQYSGRLYEGDTWLRQQLKSRLPELAKTSEKLASYGVTGVTDTTPHNGLEEWQFFQRMGDRGDFPQKLRVMGTHALQACKDTSQMQRGEYKIHLMEAWLPEFDLLCEDIRSTHAGGRNVAIHCVSLVELLFILGVLEEVGVLPGDRIEHAAITPPEQLCRINALGLVVVTQPNFIAERGDQYLQDVVAEEQPYLYRCHGYFDADIPLAAGSDAPFGNPDPWFSMRAAVARSTPRAKIVGAEEALSPEQAVGLFLAELALPGGEPRRVAPGAAADLCLLDCPWQEARTRLHSRHVRMTWCSGELVYCVDQAPS